MFQNLVCPVSPLRVNENVVRIVAALVVLLTASYLLTSSIYPVLLLLIDFYIRAFTQLRYSPLSWLGNQIRVGLGLQEILIDKAPKIFAARVGFLFSLAILLLAYLHPPSSIVVAILLIVFALLESVLNLCVGCLVYTYLVFPFFNRGPHDSKAS